MLTELFDLMAANTSRGFDDLKDRLFKFFFWSVIVLVAALFMSAASETRAFLPLVGLLYVGIITLILISAETLRAAGLLLSADVALDLYISVLPPTREKLGRLVTLDLDWSRTKRFATLQLFGRALFNVLVMELLVIVFFSIVPVWVIGLGTLVWLALLFTIFGLLSTPWGNTPLFAGLRAIIFLAIVGICAYSGWDYAYEKADKLVDAANSFNFHGHSMIIVIVVLAAVLLVSKLASSAMTTTTVAPTTKAPTGEHK